MPQALVAGGAVTVTPVLNGVWTHEPNVAAQADGTAHLIWRQDDDPADQIYYTALNGTPAVISTGACVPGGASASVTPLARRQLECERHRPAGLEQPL